MHTTRVISIFLVLHASALFANGARVKSGCAKFQANYVCNNLISWYENTINDVFHSQKVKLNMGEKDGVACAAMLVKKYPGQVDVCKEALEKLIDAKHVQPKDLEGLPELKTRAQQVALITPINVDLAEGADNSIPRCKSGEVALSFPTVKIFGWVRTDDRTVGAETQVECGSKARDPSAKIGLICTAREDSHPIWKIKSGECLSPAISCPASTYKVTFTMRREGMAAKDTHLSFSLPEQENPGIKNIDYTVDCTKGSLLTEYNARKVTGGQVNFECTTDGKWIIGKGDAACTWEDDTPTLPHGQSYTAESTDKDVASMGVGACEGVRMRFMYSDGNPTDYSVHVLPAAPANKEVTMPCDKPGWAGTVLYKCKDKEWDTVEEPGVKSCYKPDTCVGVSYGIAFSGSFDAKVTFKLGDTALGSRKELSCASATTEPSIKLKGTTIFECSTGPHGQPKWEKVSSDCQKDGPAPPMVKPAKPHVQNTGADLGPGSCEEVRMNFKYNGGGDADVSTHALPATPNDGEVTRPCDVEGWSGEVVYVCKNGQFDIKNVPGKPACYRSDRCLANGMGLTLSGSVNAQLSFKLPETKVEEFTPDLPCSEATTEKKLKGTIKFKCVKGADGRPSWATGPSSCAAA